MAADPRARAWERPRPGDDAEIFAKRCYEEPEMYSKMAFVCTLLLYVDACEAYENEDSTLICLTSAWPARTTPSPCLRTPRCLLKDFRARIRLTCFDRMRGNVLWRRTGTGDRQKSPP